MIRRNKPIVFQPISGVWRTRTIPVLISLIVAPTGLPVSAAKTTLVVLMNVVVVGVVSPETRRFTIRMIRSLKSVKVVVTVTPVTTSVKNVVTTRTPLPPMKTAAFVGAVSLRTTRVQALMKLSVVSRAGIAVHLTVTLMGVIAAPKSRFKPYSKLSRAVTAVVGTCANARTTQVAKAKPGISPISSGFQTAVVCTTLGAVIV